MKKLKSTFGIFNSKKIKNKELVSLKGGDDYRRLKTISDFGLEKMVPLEEEPFELTP